MNARSTTIVAVSAVLGILAVLVVSLRFQARHMQRQKLGVDDALLLTALVLTIGVVVIDIIAATWARVGEHEIFITEGPEAGYPFQWEIDRQSIVLFTIQILHTCAMPTIKAYTLVFYLRIFVFRRFKMLVFAVGLYVFLWWVAVILIALFQCQPVGGTYSLISKCLMGREFLKAQQIAGVLNVISDLVIILMPIPVVLKLQMPMQHKMTVVGIFLTGSMVLVAGIGRTISYYQTPHDYDFSYHDYYFLIWTSIEPCMAIIGACLPSCRPIFKHYSPESIVRSIRTAFSLRSTSSRNEVYADTDREATRNRPGSSTDGLQLSEHISSKKSVHDGRSSSVSEV
ncbi:hypothetical protein HYFRA_00010771 [Hymenoscyphus fraxineus]|uniref:Rhodopsin domain-containing protein n=1 Tax=Hymenoscyphus fraxineus TaxID=746836 RepID=A0A9N9L422_9HELO|nr:hypothetical protein HYFRA_00010771 [Hymenoscyphus fraxineus]